MTSLHTPISIYSIIVAILWFNGFILIFGFFRQRSALIAKWGISTLIVMLVVSILRIVLAVEIPNAIIIPSDTVLPYIISILKTEIFTIGSNVISLWNIIIFIMIVGTTIKLLLIGINHYKTLSYFSRIHLLDTSVEEAMMSGILAQENRNRNVRIKKSAAIDMPKTVGIINPCIYLPQHDYDDNELYYIIKHELTHIYNYDILAKLFVEIICALLWWNPCVYILRRDCNRTLEFICDNRIIKNMDEKSRLNYTNTLLMVSETSRANDDIKYDAASAFIGCGDKTEIEQRFDLIIDYNANSKKHFKAFVGAVTICILMFAASYVFVIQPDYKIPEVPSMEFWKQLNPIYAVQLEEGYLIYLDDNTMYKIDSTVFDEYYSDVEIVKMNEE